MSSTVSAAHRDAGYARRAAIAAMPVSARDREILLLAFGERAPSTFARAVGALRAAVAARIPTGRVFLLAEEGPVIGSLVSGVGIAPSARGVLVLRVKDGARVVLGEITP